MDWLQIRLLPKQKRTILYDCASFVAFHFLFFLKENLLFNNYRQSCQFDSAYFRYRHLNNKEWYSLYRKHIIRRLVNDFSQKPVLFYYQEDLFKLIYRGMYNNSKRHIFKESWYDYAYKNDVRETVSGRMQEFYEGLEMKTKIRFVLLSVVRYITLLVFFCTAVLGLFHVFFCLLFPELFLPENSVQLNGAYYYIMLSVVICYVFLFFLGAMIDICKSIFGGT